MKSITVSDENGNKYKLEFTKKSVIRMESEGFIIEDINKTPVTQITLLVHGAFWANYPNVKDETIEEIYGSLKDKTAFLEKLAEMYAEHAEKLVEEGNSDWVANW